MSYYLVKILETLKNSYCGNKDRVVGTNVNTESVHKLSQASLEEPSIKHPCFTVEI